MGEMKEYTFEELCKIVGAIAAEYGILKVYLFGSRARGDNRPDSDYDFCIVAPEGMGLFKMGGFYGKLEEALGTEIDIISERAMKDDFSRDVLRDRRLLYEVSMVRHEGRPAVEAVLPEDHGNPGIGICGDDE